MLFLPLVWLAFAGCEKPAAPHDDALYQVASYSVFATGEYDGFYPYEDILAKGDFGIGTFDRLNGEMVLLDGVVYRIEPEGLPVNPPADPKAPLATFCQFEADLEFDLEALDLSAIKYYIDSLLPDLDLFYAIRIEGDWVDLVTRSVYAQDKPYQPLTEVLKNEVRRSTAAASGTIVGFRAPEYMTVPLWSGYHLHFISDDRQLGGHLHEATAERVTVKVDVMKEFKLILE